MTYQSQISSKTARPISADQDASGSSGPRPATHGRVQVAMDVMKQASEEHPIRSLSETNTEHEVHEALYQMKGLRCVQEQKQDDATIAILLEIPLAYQLDLIVQRFLHSDEEYPLPSVMDKIIAGLTDEGVFTGVDSFR